MTDKKNTPMPDEKKPIPEENKEQKSTSAATNATEPKTESRWERRNRERMFHRGNRSWGGNIVGAFVLITLGTIFLLNNFGIISWQIWSILWRFWPMFLIIPGLQLIFGKSAIGRFIVTILSLFLIAAIILFVLMAGNPAFQQKMQSSFPNMNFNMMRDWIGTPRTITNSIAKSEFPNTETLTFSMEHPYGKFQLTDTPDSNWVTATSEFNNIQADPKLNRSLSDNILRAEYNLNFSIAMMTGFDSTLTSKVNLGNPTARTNVNLTLNSGEGEVNLNQLNIGTLSIATNSGLMNINLDGTATPKNDFLVTLHSGTTNITLPHNAAMKINYDIRSGIVIVNGKSMWGSGEFTTDGYEAAGTQITMKLTVDSGIANIDQK